MISLKRAKEICAQFKDKRILVYGDVILDRYIFGSVDRISPEAPVPVLKVEKEELRSGGAGNVAMNVDKLGAVGMLMGIIGDDFYGSELERLKPKDEYLIKSDRNGTLVKTRVISQRQQIVRIDREEPIEITPLIRDRLNRALAAMNQGDLHGIIVSDYAKGSLDQAVMDLLKEKAETLALPIIVDPKPPNYHLYKNITGITPNLKEAEAVVNKRIKDDTEAAAAVKQIRNKFNADFAMVTRGAGGISAGERGRQVFHLPAFNHEVYDVTGAGDTVVSALILALVSGGDLREAAALSNVAASIVVERIGASQVTVEELLDRVKFLLR